MTRLIAAALVFAATSASAQTLEQKQYQDAQLKGTTEGALRVVNQACGSAIAVSYDWSGFADADREKLTASSYCDMALSGIRDVCAKPDGARAIARDVHAMVCRFAPKGGRAVSLQGGTLSWTIDVTENKNPDFVYDYLQSRLAP